VLRPVVQVAAWTLAALVLAPSALARTAAGDVRAALGQLAGAGFAEKAALVERLSAGGDPAVRPALEALLDERLFVRDADGQVFIVKSVDESLTSLDLVDPVTLQDAGAAPRDQLSRVTTNNRLRSVLRSAIARFDLASPDAAGRLAAVQTVLRTIDGETVALLRSRAAVERDPRVKEEIEIGLALAALDGGDADARLEAVAALAHGLQPQIRNRLAALLESSPDGSVAEPDARVRTAAAMAVRRIDRARTAYAMVETLFFGLSAGSVLVLIAAGLAITFGVMGVINMAHGELMMLGAYTTYVMQQALPDHPGAALLLSIPAAFAAAGLTGVILERAVIRPLYGRPLETLLATFGVSLVLQQFVRTVFSANNRAVATPAWMSGTLQMNGALSITLNRLYIMAFTAIVFAVLVVVLRHTRFGLTIRAVSQNRPMAQAMGIRTSRVDALTFGLGSGIAGLAGVALSQFTNVGPNLGQSYILDSFMVVVFGGVGNVWGTLVGGLSIGVVDQLLEPYAGAVLAKIGVLVALIVFIQRWPRGLFPQTGRAA
jgi:urea transport system permease protein